MIAVGALPRNVSYSNDSPENSYALSWSVDGLVNEYIRPCEVRIGGKELKVAALTGRTNLIIDGQRYEAALTSGGIGSLVKELKHVPNVWYSTIRYTGHYDYVIDAVRRHRGEFFRIKDEFLKKFPFTKDDMIVTFAEARGYNKHGVYVKETFAQRFYSAYPGLTTIQTTTAVGGLAVLELIMTGSVSGIITHSMVSIQDFKNMKAFNYGYATE